MNGRVYMASASALAVVDGGDFFQLRNTTARSVLIHAVHVSQTSDLSITAMQFVNIRRGVGGLAGTGLDEWENDVSGVAAGATAFSLPTTDVGTADWDAFFGWNILQEFVWLPTPEMRLKLKASDHLGIAIISDTLTVNVTVFWEESGT